MVSIYLLGEFQWSGDPGDPDLAFTLAQHLGGSLQSEDQVQCTTVSSLSVYTHWEEGKQSSMVITMKATGLRKIRAQKEWIQIQHCHLPAAAEEAAGPSGSSCQPPQS